MKIKNIFGMSLAFLAMTPMVSCTDKNDWDVDSAHDRLFGVKSSALSVDTDDDQPPRLQSTSLLMTRTQNTTS